MSGGALHPLVDDQRAAVEPDDQVWLSASAGTGKTQVLTARVFRLLLEPDVRPESLLCLTFTKAGASEMANRIHARLAAWVRMDDAQLATDLKHIGAAVDPDTRARARRLFARVLDAPHGGLRIQTIHSFCQTLLAGFPSEADIAPGFKPIEDRDRAMLARQVLGDMLIAARAQGDGGLVAGLEALSLRLGPQEAEAYLLRCAAAPDAMAYMVGDIVPYINAALGLPRGEDEASIADLCADDALDLATSSRLEAAQRDWGTKTGLESADAIRAWINAGPETRLARLDEIVSVFLTRTGDPRKTKPKVLAILPDYDALAERVVAEIVAIRDRLALVRFARELSQALTVGRAFAFHFADSKRRAGAMDFDDLIRAAAQLLSVKSMAEWIRFKMDQQFDHILVDESQDTNARQWEIVWGLISDFFAGSGSKADRSRTLFTVGDFKQAIFGFQGTSPRNYEAARTMIGEHARQGGQPLQRLSLVQSFRSAQPILDLVDCAIETVGYEALGLDDAPPSHFGRDAPGQVALWRPVRVQSDDELDDSETDATEPATGGESDPEDWMSRADRIFARQLAERISDWTSGSQVTGGLWLSRRKDGSAGWARPGDIMILLRRRGDLAALIVARLYAMNVAVAGIDRLRLGQPLGVKDLMATIRFVLQPLDDLNLASLLVSPLLGWSQEELLLYGHRPARRRLWEHLRERAAGDDALDARIEPLRVLLNSADYGTPYEFLEAVLSGPLQGRAKLVARLGREVLDPVGELLNVAQLFERDHDASLQGFLHWFDRGDEEIKREQAEAMDAVRVMTVHGAKGLQAPIVILADCCVDPTRKSGFGLNLPVGNDLSVPIYSPRKEERVGLLARLAEAAQAQDMAEHWRLLYVAMTRAEERLFIAGTLGVRDKEPPAESWYTLIDRAMASLGCEWLESDAPGAAAARVYGEPAKCREAIAKRPDSIPREAEAPLPQWLLTSAAPEQRPPSPLAPSAAGRDDSASPPATGPIQRLAAQRGLAMHALFERLSAVPRDKRVATALQWLERMAGFAEVAEREAIVTAVMTVMDNPQWVELFGPDALAEAPIAALVGDRVVSGTADRLLIEVDRVMVVDFKTSRRPPRDMATVPMAHVRQMAAYAAALNAIYPDRKVEAALLYTETPQLIVLPDDLLASVKLD